MKRTILLFALLFTFSSIFSNNIEINFTANGASTTIDSVKVENHTKGTTIIIAGNDVLQLTTSSTGITSIENKDNIYIIPNPIKNEGEIHFNNPISGNVNIRLFDANGKTLISLKENLQLGKYVYSVSGLQNGLYFVNIAGAGYSYNASILSTSSNVQPITLKQKTERIDTDFKLKSLKSIISMEYNIGDEFIFTGYSGLLTDAVSDIPTINKTITFTFQGVPPISLFTINSESLTIGKTISFIDQSTNTPTTWEWDFGDGTTSTLQNCNHIYSTDGTYNVTLTTSNEFGKNSITKQIVVKGKGTVKGIVTIISGNCMPSPPIVINPSLPPSYSACQTTTIQTKVVITSKAKSYNPDLLILSTYSSDDGTYQIELPEGEYSLFVINTTDFDWEYWSESNNGWNFTITKNKITNLDININNAVW